MKEKVLSLLLCFVYLVGSYLYADAGTILFVAAGLIVPLVGIWFSEELASFLGPSGRRMLRGPSPTIFVKLAGWLLLLLLPVAALLL